MTIHPSPELEARLHELARRTGRDVDALAQEALERFVDHEAWFAEQVAEGTAQLDRDESVSHEDVGARLHRLLHEP